MQTSLQRQLQTGANFHRKTVGASKVTTAADDKHLIIDSKRQKEN